MYFEEKYGTGLHQISAVCEWPIPTGTQLFGLNCFIVPVIHLSICRHSSTTYQQGCSVYLELDMPISFTQLKQKLTESLFLLIQALAHQLTDLYY